MATSLPVPTSENVKIATTPRKISTAVHEPMRIGEHWKEQWSLLSVQQDGSMPDSAAKRIEAGIKKIDFVHSNLVSTASNYFEIQTDTLSKSESFSESMIQLGMYQRRTALGSMLCKYGGLLRMLDTFKEQILEGLNQVELCHLRQAGATFQDDLKSIGQRGSNEEVAIDHIALASGRFEVALGKTLSSAVEKHLEYFEYGYTLFKNLESEIKSLREECMSLGGQTQSSSLSSSTYHRFPLMTTTLKDDRIQRLFGASLNEAVNSDANEGHSIPFIIEKCTEHLSIHGIQSEGLFRQSGSQEQLLKLRELFEKNTASSIELSEFENAHDVASLLKAYLRELPNPLMTFELYSSFLECSDILNHSERIKRLRSTIKLLPKVNRKVLEHLLTFLKTIHENSTQTRMTNETLSIVFAPVLLKPLQDQSFMMADAGKCFEIISYMIANCPLLFMDEPQAQIDQTSSSDPHKPAEPIEDQKPTSTSQSTPVITTRSHSFAMMTVPEGRIIPSRFSQASFGHIIAPQRIRSSSALPTLYTDPSIRQDAHLLTGQPVRHHYLAPTYAPVQAPQENRWSGFFGFFGGSARS
eukprot:TRINITY_DN1202_c0_g3_i1.p1 TRINITY_DN1202_c0_g3~~TRINITY_DN1202_c0_g3_i1.p1  ORF type:complete len:583 (-),score=131.87 TRINITY_DN1202_c0_g3_i1:296-2044(-)